MGTNKSLLFSVIGLLALLAVALLATGFLFNHRPLAAVLEGHAVSQARAAAQVAQRLLDEKSARLGRLSGALADDRDIAFALSLLPHSPDAARHLLARHMSASYARMEVDLFLAADPLGTILYQAHDPNREAESVPFRERDAEPHDEIAVILDKGADGWMVRSFVTHFSASTPLGTVAVGFFFNEKLVEYLAEYLNHPVLVSDPDGQWILPAEGAVKGVEKALIAASLQQGESFFQRAGDVGFHYAPLKVADRNFCLVQRVDLAPFNLLLAESQRRLIQSALALLAMIALFILVAWRHFIVPLRHLRAKALLMVEACSSRVLADRPMPPSNNELVVLDHAFEMASMTIYAHIAELQQEKATLARMAGHDHLTGLPNRRLFNDAFERAIRRSGRTRDPVAILFCDLDHFKEVNDTHGHEVGDALLKEAAVRLQGCVRGYDTVSRFGGDEFAILLVDDVSSTLTENVARRINESIRQPFDLMGKRCRVGVSIGISIYPGHGEDAGLLLKKADLALYEVKRKGRDGYLFYSKEI